MKDIEYILRYYSINFFRVKGINNDILTIEYPMPTGLYLESFALKVLLKGGSRYTRSLIDIFPDIVKRQTRYIKTYSVRNKWKARRDGVIL